MELSKKELIARFEKIEYAWENMAPNEASQYRALATYMGSGDFLSKLTATKTGQLIALNCFANIFRVFSPASIYNNVRDQKRILMFFIEQLKGLGTAAFTLYSNPFTKIMKAGVFELSLKLGDPDHKVIMAFFHVCFKVANAKSETLLCDDVSTHVDAFRIEA